MIGLVLALLALVTLGCSLTGGYLYTGEGLSQQERLSRCLAEHAWEKSYKPGECELRVSEPTVPPDASPPAIRVLIVP